MTYTPTNWKRGDIVTSEKLNNIENGVALANVFPVVTFTGTGSDPFNPTYECELTYAELHELGMTSRTVIVHEVDPISEGYSFGNIDLGINVGDPITIEMISFSMASSEALNVTSNVYTVTESDDVSRSFDEGSISI